MKKIYISVVIPIHNTKKEYLIECIESILNQTFISFEVICVDDASDNIDTVEILNKYDNMYSEISIVSLEKQSGAAISRNKGLELARGEYIFFLDSDDVFEPDFFEKMYEKVTAESADICVCGFRSFVDDTCVDYPGQVNFDKRSTDDNWLANSSMNPWTKLYRTDFIRTEQLFFQDLPAANDVYFVSMSLLLAKKIAYLNEKLFIKYRIGHAGQISLIRKEMHVVKALQNLKEELIRRGKFEGITKNQVIALTIRWGVSFVRTMRNKEERREMYKSIYQYLISVKLDSLSGIYINIVNKWCENYLDDSWLFEPVEYIYQLEKNMEIIAEIFEKQKNIYLWGLGQRGKAFYEICENNDFFFSGICDTNENAVNDKKKRLFRYVDTDIVLQQADCIIASNKAVFSYLSNCNVLKERKVNIINGQLLCPLDL